MSLRSNLSTSALSRRRFLVAAGSKDWTKRMWLAVPAARTASGAYEAALPADAARADWFAVVSDARPVSVASDLVRAKEEPR